MLPIEIIPKGRGKSDKAMYLFWRWYIKQHRKSIEKQIDKMTNDFILYGEYKGFKRRTYG